MGKVKRECGKNNEIKDNEVAGTIANAGSTGRLALNAVGVPLLSLFSRRRVGGGYRVIRVIITSLTSQGYISRGCSLDLNALAKFLILLADIKMIKHLLQLYFTVAVTILSISADCSINW